MQHPLQVGHAHVLPDHQTLDLMEHGAVGVIEGIGAVHPAGSDQPQRRAALLHRPDLNRRSMGTQQGAVVEVEGVLHRPGGMVGRDVERFEVVMVVLDLGTFHDVEADGAEEGFDAPAGQGQGVQPARGLTAPRQRHVDALLRQPGFGQMRADRLAACFERVAKGGRRFVDAPAGLGPLGRGKLADPLHLRLQTPLPAEVADPHRIDLLQRVRSRGPGQRLSEDSIHFVRCRHEGNGGKDQGPFPVAAFGLFRAPPSNEGKRGARGGPWRWRKARRTPRRRRPPCRRGPCGRARHPPSSGRA